MNVDSEQPPYRHTRILTTNYPGTAVDSKTALTTAISYKNRAAFRLVWVYMLTEL